jgi:hypothetical protein
MTTRSFNFAHFHSHINSWAKSKELNVRHAEEQDKSYNEFILH